MPKARAWRAGLAALLLGLACALALAQQAVPRLDARVTDLTGTLGADQRRALEAELAALERETGAQVAVLVVASTAPEDIAAYAIRVFDQWRLGRAGVDDGVLLLVAREDRRVRIEVARGLEGAIPDAAAARIIRECIAPRFRANDWYGGIHDAVGALALLVRDEPLPPPLVDEEPAAHEGERIATALIAAWFVAVFLRGLMARRRALPRAAVTGGGAGGVAWLLSGLAGVGIGAAVLGGLFGLFGGGGGGFARRGGSGPFGGAWGGGMPRGGGYRGGRSGGFGGGFRGGGGMSAGGGASGGW